MARVLDEKSSLYILIAVTLGAFLIPYMGSSLNVSLPTISRDFAVDLVVLNWIPTAFILANAAFILPFGRLGDLFGRKKVFTTGVLIFTLASLLAAIAPSAYFLLFFSFLQGLGCSMIFATGVAILSSVFPMGSRGESFGIYVTSVYLGLFLGPLLGGFLTQNLGWRSIFLFNIPLGLIMLSILFLKVKKDWIGSPGESFDLKGTLIYLPSVIILLYGFTTIYTLSGIILILGGILGIVAFLKIEKENRYPLLQLRLFKSAVPLLASGAILLLNTSTSAVWLLISLYLQFIQLLTPINAGIILAINPLVVAIISPFAGRLSDNIGGASLSLLGLIITVLGLFLAIFIGLDTSLFFIIVLAIILGIGIAVFSSPITNTFMASVDHAYFGSASATFSTFIFVGQLSSLAIVLLVFATTLGAVEVDYSYNLEFILSLRIIFIIFTLLCLLGVILISFMWLKLKSKPID